MFRWLLALALAVGLGFAVVGCGNEEPGSTKTTTTEKKGEPMLFGGKKDTSETKTETKKDNNAGDTKTTTTETKTETKKQ